MDRKVKWPWLWISLAMLVFFGVLLFDKTSGVSFLNTGSDSSGCSFPECGGDDLLMFRRAVDHGTPAIKKVLSEDINCTRDDECIGIGLYCDNYLCTSINKAKLDWYFELRKNECGDLTVNEIQCELENLRCNEYGKCVSY